MPHVITGQIRKSPFTKEGSNNNGRWKMYAVELSERMKIRNQNGEDETVYSNYSAIFFAKENVIQWYDEAFQEGNVVSISADTLHLSSRQGNDGTVYVTAEMIRPQLQFSQRKPAQQQSQGQNRQQPQQQQQQQQRQQQQPNQSIQFDDDIPF